MQRQHIKTEQKVCERESGYKDKDNNLLLSRNGT